MEIDTSLQIGSMRLPNPVGVASGTYGFGEEYSQLYDINKLGGLYTKALTCEPREGNPLPRLVETPSGIINSIGLANVGLKKFREQKLSFLKNLKCPVVLNVGGSSAEDYKQVIEETESLNEIDAFEINISCPNVKKGCLAFGTDPKGVEQLISFLRPSTLKPMIVKLTPNVTRIEEIAAAAETAGADAISCINTVRGMVVDIKRRKPVLAAVSGGLSGPAIKPIGVAAVYAVSHRVNIPVIGIGGISSTNDAIEYLLAGASAIQIGTANFTNPGLAFTMIEEIFNYMKDNGLNKITDFHQFF